MEFAKAAKISCDNGLNISFHVFGAQDLGKSMVNKLKSAIGVNQDASHEIKEFIKLNALEEVLYLHPFNENLTEIYCQINVLCFPSHLNAVGRPVFEKPIGRYNYRWYYWNCNRRKKSDPAI